MKTGSLPTSYTKTGLTFADSTHLDADVIVFATGYLANMRDLVRNFFGDKVADKAGDCWGVDSEGEVKGAYKPTGRMYLVLSYVLKSLSVLLFADLFV
jgi:hypothetical protein